MDKSNNTRLYGMLGFAMRAGKVVIGTEPVCSAMSERASKRARLVLISCTASQGTKDKILHKAEFYGVEAVKINIDSSELGRLLGKLYAPAAVAIIDDRFAEEIRLAIKTDDGNSESSN